MSWFRISKSNNLDVNNGGSRRLPIASISLALLLLLPGCSHELPPEVLKARQSHQPGNNHPIEYPHISGSFGEYRTGGRFHPGLDYKTFNRNGLPIHAVDDVTAARLYTSEVGYGNGLVLAAADGRHYTYGHMYDFMGKHPDLEYLREALYLMHPFNRASINLPGYFHFKKGEVIGRSGESGSGAPHLHFEVGAGGYYRSPLEDSDRAINDFTAPVILRLHTSSRSFRARRANRSYTKDGHTIDFYLLEGREAVAAGQFRIGTYDTMAALNRNGIHGVAIYFLKDTSLEVAAQTDPEEAGGAPLYRMELNGIATSEFRTADRYYDPERTVIGEEYAYYLYDTLKAQKPKWEPGTYIAEVFDSSGNISRLAFRVKDGTEESGGETGTDTRPSEDQPFRSDTPFRQLPPYAGAVFSYSGEGVRVNIQIPGGAQSGHGKARILGPETITTFPPMDEGLEESVPRRFVFDARDLVISGYMYLLGTIQKKHPDEELYLWNASTKKWDWVGKPYSETETSATYNVRLKRGGIFAVLRDRRSPVIFPALAWQRPEDNLLNEDSDKAGESIILREYEIYDQESWVDRNTTAVYLDGVPIPFEWAGDRSLLRIRVAEKWIAADGSFLSIDVSDLAGNPATTYFDVIERE